MQNYAPIQVQLEMLPTPDKCGCSVATGERKLRWAKSVATFKDSKGFASYSIIPSISIGEITIFQHTNHHRNHHPKSLKKKAGLFQDQWQLSEAFLRHAFHLTVITETTESVNTTLNSCGPIHGNPKYMIWMWQMKV